MIKLTRGRYGKALLPAGTKLTLTEIEEKRLVERKVAEYVNDEENDNRKNAADINGEEIIYDDEEVFKTEEEIRSMKKDELIAYAEEIGIKDFDTKVTKDVMIDAILNYIEENSIDVEEVIK